MRRIVWIAVTILIMLGIMGFGIYTLNHIDEVNQRRREKEAGEKIASQIVMTTATTSIWDKLRTTTESVAEGTDEGAPADENAPAMGDVPVDGAVPADDGNTPDNDIATIPAQEQMPEGIVPDVPEQADRVTTGIVIHID